MFENRFTKFYNKGILTRSKLVQETSKEMRIHEQICGLVERSNVVCRLGKAIPANINDKSLISALSSSYVQSIMREAANSVGALLDTYSSLQESEGKKVALEVVKEIAVEATTAALYNTIVAGNKCDTASNKHQEQAERKLLQLENRRTKKTN